MTESDTATSPAPMDFLADCRMMLRFARKEGKELLPELEHEIAELDTLLSGLSLPPISDIPAAVVSGGGQQSGDAKAGVAARTDAAAATAPKSVTELVLHVHGELSKVIVPATALSLQTTEPLPGRYRVFSGLPVMVQAAAIIAFFCAVGFVITAALIGRKAAEATPMESVQKQGGAAKSSAEPKDTSRTEETKAAAKDTPAQTSVNTEGEKK